MASQASVAVLGAGIQGTSIALELARRGVPVDLYDKAARPFTAASLWNEGKIHLGFVYAFDTPERTARLMVQGSLRFWEETRRWVALDEGILSDPFAYVVPDDSMLEIGAVERHFDAVAEQYAELRSATGLRYLAEDTSFVFERLGDAEIERWYDPSRVQGAFRTIERAVDPHVVADRFRRAVAAQPSITFLGNRRVEGVDRSGTGAFVVRSDTERRYDQVVNALWDDRLRVDAGLGLAPHRPWLHRFKTALHTVPQRTVEAARTTTMILGPYGDVTGFTDGHYYLSWYPTCHLGSSTDLTPPPYLLDDEQRRRIVEGTIAGLSAIVPAVADIDVTGARIEGGEIFGWGAGDITDPSSELHQRFDIGPMSHDGYHTVDTGKYSMAPAFAVDTADRVTA